jgi:glycerophosphoryl diester phosphodiesterase
MDGEPATLHGSARVQRSGKLTLAFTMNPWTKGLTFSGKAALRELDLRELYALTEDKSALEAVRGTASVFVELKARNDVLTGGVKPELKDVEVASVKKDLGDQLKALAADAAVHLASHNDQRVATVIPIEGKLSGPHLQIVPAILGVVRNAFVEGLASGFSQLPPPVAEKKEGVLKQAVKALKKNNGPPEAQPEPPRTGRKS